MNRKSYSLLNLYYNARHDAAGDLSELGSPPDLRGRIIIPSTDGLS